MRCVLVLVVLGWVLPGPLAAGQRVDAPSAQSLQQILLGAGIPVAGLGPEDLARPVSDFAIEHGARASAVAFHGAGLTAAPLHVRVRDNATGRWRAAIIPAESLHHGVVTQIVNVNDYWIVETERDEALGQLIVLDDSLREVERHEATLLAILEDGAVLLRENLADQRPARPLAISAVWPGSGVRARLYPVPPWSPVRQSHIDRVKRAYAGWGLRGCLAAGHHCNAEQFDAAVVSEVRADHRARRIAWVVRFGPPEGATSGPVDFRSYAIVTCSHPVPSVPPACRERPFAEYDGPDGHRTQSALLAALLFRH